MKGRPASVASFVSILLLSAAGSALAAPSPVQLALFDPVQIVKSDQSVGILRIDLIYGKNAGVTGLDVGLINHTTGDEGGLGYGVANIVQGSFTGWQDGIVNIADKSFLGLQSGAFNRSQDGHGVQWGIVNVTEKMSGLQVGIVNYTRVMTKGVQIGVGNIILEGGIPFLPIVNARF
jgi:hypothetical protein